MLHSIMYYGCRYGFLNKTNIKLFSVKIYKIIYIIIQIKGKINKNSS